MLPGPHRPGHRQPVLVAATALTPTAAASPRRRSPSGIEAEILKVEVGAVAVEMHHVIRPPRIAGGVQHLRQPGEGGRAQHIQVQALHLLRPAAHQPGGHRPERHIRPAARPADRQQHPQPVPGRLRQPRIPAARKWVRTNAPAPSATAASRPGSRSNSHARPGPAPGSVSTSTRASRKPVPRPLPDPRRVPVSRTPAGTAPRPSSASRASASRASAGAGSAGNSA